RTCQSRRAAADYGHLVPVGRCCRMRSATVVEFPVANEPLQLADGHRLALDAEHAGTFALRLLRAYAAAYGRPRRVCGDDRRSSGHIAGQYFSDKIGYLYRNRTVRHALRFFAVQTARGFKLRLAQVVTVTNFVEIRSPYFRVLLPYRDTRNLVSHILFTIYLLRDAPPFIQIPARCRAVRMRAAYSPRP